MQSWLAEGFQALAVGTARAVGRARGHDESPADQVTWSLDASKQAKDNYKDATLLWSHTRSRWREVLCVGH